MPGKRLRREERRHGSVVARGDARHVGAVLVVAAEVRERQRRLRRRHARRHERPRDDHLRRRECRVPLRIARRVLVAGGVEERVRLVDALVDDPDLHPLTRVRERRPPDDGRADQLRRAIEARAVGRARPDTRDAGNAGEPRHRSARHHDCEAVQSDAVAPVDVRAGDRLRDAARDDRLLAIELLEVADRRRRRELQPPAARRERGERRGRSPRHPRARERAA